ncbi:zinc finger SWIM domain-containing protein 7 isoform X1 [Trichechus manatus latirostris]|uniref:Zinc finger SWIM domain-containing protein 7 isoform X1 n=1 Tax=Trichechus manatus latirostris TaxID=127582 RepID=A0A2Y9R5H0_TRIMA|nr:zinc finger SWIM domain-containing protein 7 isoform X1 [Trichechus manatus latirostris]
MHQPGEAKLCNGNNDPKSQRLTKVFSISFMLHIYHKSFALLIQNIFTQWSQLMEQPPSGTLWISWQKEKEDMVLGSSGKTYTCLASCHYCSCPAFAFSVLRKSDSLLCKHLLAIYLSQVMGTCQQLSVSDKQLTDILLTEEEQERKGTD